MLPMSIIEFRFREEPPPREVLLSGLRGELGPRGDRKFDSVDIVDDRVRLLSQNPVALLYGAKVCQSLGGRAVRRGVPSEGRIPIPNWAQRPWCEQGLLARVQHRLGRISLCVVPR